VHLGTLGADAHFLGAQPDQRTQVAAFQVVGLDHVDLRLHQLVKLEGHGHAQDLGAVEQTLGVLTQTENRGALVGLVGAHAFESAAAIVQRVGQHVDLGVAPLHHLAVHPDLAVAIVHRHGGESFSKVSPPVWRSSNLKL